MEIKQFGRLKAGNPGTWKRPPTTGVLSSITEMGRLVLRIRGIGCGRAKLRPKETAELLRIIDDVLPDDVWPQTIEVYGFLCIGRDYNHQILGRDFRVTFAKVHNEDRLGHEW